jgi:hypothetical protein
VAGAEAAAGAGRGGVAAALAGVVAATGFAAAIKPPSPRPKRDLGAADMVRYFPPGMKSV